MKIHFNRRCIQRRCGSFLNSPISQDVFNSLRHVLYIYVKLDDVHQDLHISKTRFEYTYSDGRTCMYQDPHASTLRPE